MRHHLISDIVWTCVGIFIILGVIRGVNYLGNTSSPFVLRQKIDNFLSDINLRLRIIRHNIATDFKRARPLKSSLLLKETQLKSYIGQPFIDFSPAEWRYFWHLIYGYKSESTSLGQSIKVPYSRSEIENILCDNYDIFCRFSDRHWQIFWQLILGR